MMNKEQVVADLLRIRAEMAYVRERLRAGEIMSPAQIRGFLRNWSINLEAIELEITE
jgi:hypothetical protein